MRGLLVCGISNYNYHSLSIITWWVIRRYWFLQFRPTILESICVVLCEWDGQSFLPNEGGNHRWDHGESFLATGQACQKSDIRSHSLFTNIMFSILRRPPDHQCGCPISHFRPAFLHLQFCQFIRLQAHGWSNSQSTEANRRAHCKLHERQWANDPN